MAQGDNICSLTPAGVTPASLQGAPDPSGEGADTISNVLQTAGQYEKGLPPPQDMSPLGEEGSGSGSG
eukprot:3987845-Lingulodinium_polyedra.AAC.1